MPTLFVKTRLECPREEAERLVQSSSMLRHIASPLVIFKPVEPAFWPDTWHEGEYLAAMRFLGLVPIGRQTIQISFEDHHPRAPGGAFIVRDEGSGQLIRVWDHWIFISEDADGGTAYADLITIKAGWFTPFATVFAWTFYHWRQFRWRSFVRKSRRA